MNGTRGRKLRQVNDRYYSFDAIKGYFDIFLQVDLFPSFSRTSSFYSVFYIAILWVKILNIIHVYTFNPG